MFKSWQIFVFSLVPLALVFIGVIGGSIHGSDSSKEVFPTPVPQATRKAVLPSNSGPSIVPFDSLAAAATPTPR